MRTHLPRLEGWRLDAALALFTGAVLLVSEPLFAAERGIPVSVPALVLLGAGAASLAAVSRLPYLTAVLAPAAMVLYYMVSASDGWMAWMLLLVTVVRLAAVGNRACVATSVLVALGAVLIGEGLSFDLWRALAVVAWLIVIFAVGESVRNRNAYLREVEERAAEAERGREEEARLRATEERLRIARELHDVVAHNISLINVQAGAAAHRRDPEEAFRALEAIRGASKETLRELRATLGALRQVDEEHTGGAPAAPAPTLDRLPDLVEHTRASGLEVELDTSGLDTAAAVPAPTALAVYRIVQEALTNALRHSGAHKVRVRVADDGGAIAVEVDDDGRGGGEDPHEGNGLRGMRERAAALGGAFSAGTRPGGGFTVEARVPHRPTGR
ncbi:sensor histidine kinase [Nocardiopsis suaedae]|uniref:histidine kinase n=1 Tax=Nocardiopsis suaedae TaxID=3018444 RepID=A0ABT4TGI6_9ACTN|nr:histidine kinase [Nocardiopsis suaedae]MDA2803510.1 histidine kinase [Nocardiopsis suaedae]